MEKRQGCHCGFIVSGSDSPESFDVVKKTFNKIPHWVKFLIVSTFFVPRFTWGNDGFYASQFQSIDNTIGVVSSIGQTHVAVNVIYQFFSNRRFVLLSRCESKSQWSSFDIDPRMNLR